MNRHVVFGTGQVGHPLVEELVARGYDVVAVNRDGRGSFPGAKVVGGDATDPAFTAAVCQGADVVYFCLNAMNYERWTEEFPPLQRGVVAGAASAGARLVVLDNLYAYGPPLGQRLVETMAANPTSEKAATRAAMTEELLSAHGSGRVEVVIGRASDYFGPGAMRSALGEAVFGAALSGKAAQVMGDPDQPHSYSYTPDVAAGLVRLGTAPGATGEIWHLPVAGPLSTRQLIEQVYVLSGSQDPRPGRRTQDLARDRSVQAADARVPPHALPVHRAVGRRRRQVPGRLRRPCHAPGRGARHHPHVVPRRSTRPHPLIPAHPRNQRSTP